MIQRFSHSFYVWLNCLNPLILQDNYLCRTTLPNIIALIFYFLVFWAFNRTTKNSHTI